MRIVEAPRRRPIVNVTSLIDVMFLLLTFFLVTTRFIDQAALKVELPAMAHADRVQHERRFVLNVAENGAMTLDDEQIELSSLGDKLTGLATEIDASGGLVLRADRGLTYGEVMGILDVVRGAGIRRISNAAADAK